MHRNLLALFCWGVTISAAVADEPVSFVREVLPVLKSQCFACHDAKQRKGNYDMTSFSFMQKGGDRGVAVVAGKPEESFLWTLTSGTEEPKMPPAEAKSTLMPQHVALIERWIKEGARFDGADPKGNLQAELRRTWQPPAPPRDYAMPVPIKSLVFSPDGRFLFSSGWHEILIWEVQSGKLKVRLRTRAERANAMVFLPDGVLAVAGGRPGQEGDVRLYRLDWKLLAQSDQVKHLDGTQTPSEITIRELVQTDDEVLALAVSKDGKKLAAAGADRLIRVWSIEADFTLTDTLETHADWVLGVAFSRDGSLLFSAGRDASAKVWNFAEGKSTATFAGHEKAVHAVVPEVEGRFAISVGEDQTIRIWRLQGNPRQMQVRALTGHEKAVHCIAAQPGKNDFVTAGADATIRFWNPTNGAVLRTLTGHSEWIFALAFSHDGNLLASGDWKGEIRIWDASKGTLLRAFLASPKESAGGE